MIKKTLLIAALIAAPFAQAEAGDKVVKKIGQQDGRAALERFRKAGQGTRGTTVQPARAKRTQLIARLVRGGDGAVFLEREVDARTAEQLLRMGFRTIQSEKQINDKTVLGTKVYLLYEMDKDASAVKSPELLQDKQVSFEVRHDSQGTPLVTSLRRLER